MDPDTGGASHDVRGRDWSGAATGREMPRITRSPEAMRGREHILLEPPRRNLPSALCENTFVLR